MRFLITGCGRSGTMFLAKALARSRKVVVRHEHADDARGWFKIPGGYDPDGHLGMAIHRFARDNYGEVNSCLRYIAEDIARMAKLDHVGVLLREPREIALSSINKFPGRWFSMRGFQERADALFKDLEAVDRLVEAGRKVIRFERLTHRERGPDTLAGVLDWLGIGDVQVEEVDFREKVNESGRGTIKNVAQLVPEHRKILRRACRWYAEKYYAGLWE